MNDFVAVTEGDVYVNVIVRESSGPSVISLSLGASPETWKLTRLSCEAISGNHGVRRLKGALNGSGISWGISWSSLSSAPFIARSTPSSLYLLRIQEVATAPRFERVARQYGSPSGFGLATIVISRDATWVVWVCA